MTTSDQALLAVLLLMALGCLGWWFADPQQPHRWLASVALALPGLAETLTNPRGEVTP